MRGFFMMKVHISLNFIGFIYRHMSDSRVTMTRIMCQTPSMRTNGHYHSIVVVRVPRYNESSDSEACQWRNELCSPSDGLWWAEDVWWRATGTDLLIGRRAYRAGMHVKLSLDRCYVQCRNIHARGIILL